MCHRFLASFALAAVMGCAAIMSAQAAPPFAPMPEGPIAQMPPPPPEPPPPPRPRRPPPPEPPPPPPPPPPRY